MLKSGRCSIGILALTLPLALLLAASPAAGAETPSITLSKAQAKPGDKVTVFGSSFPSGSVTLRLKPTGTSQDGGNITPESGCNVSNGAFACSFTVLSPVMYGTPGKIPKVASESDWTIKAIGAGGETATAPFSIGATISLSPSSGPPGTTVQITGSGFQPFDAYVYVRWGGAVLPDGTWGATVLAEGTYFSSCIPNTKGKMSCSVTVPPQAGPGTYTISVYTYLWYGFADTDATAAFTVPPPSLSLSALSGPPDTTIIASGSGYSPQTTSLRLFFADAEVTPSSGCPLIEQSFSCSFTVPDVSGGQHRFRATGWDATGNPTDLASVDFTLIYQPSLRLGPAAGQPGTTVHIQGSGFSGADTFVSLGWRIPSFFCGPAFCGPTFSFPTHLKDCPAAHGAFSCTFVVPFEQAPDFVVGVEGPREVFAFGNSGSNFGNSTSAVFTLIASPSITLNPTSGPPGTVVEVTGTHFLATDTSATLTLGPDELNVTPATGCTVSGRALSCSFVVPPIGPGCYAVAATGNGGDRGTATFTVPPLCLTVDPSSAKVSTQVAAIGNGFKSSDTSISLTVDGMDVTPPSGCALSAGSLNCVFTVPVVPAGRHIVTATSNSGDSTRGTLTVVPGMTLSPSSGLGHSSVVVTGSGLPSSVPDVQIFFSGTEVTPAWGCPVVVGTLACTITVPPLRPGAYPITLSGGSSVDDIQFLAGVSAVYTIETCTTGLSATSVCLKLNPASGHVGSSVAVSGVGFSSAARFATLTFGGVDVSPVSGCPIVGGSFLCVITAPNLPPGGQVVTAVGNPDGYSRQDVQSVSFRIVPGLSLTPSSGPPGSRVIIKGSNFASFDTLAFLEMRTTAVGVAPRGLGSCPVSNGTLSCAVDIPDRPTGTYEITARGDKSVVIGSAVFIVGPQIFSSATSGDPGGLVTITGIGFSSADSAVALSLGQVDITPSTGCGVTDNRFSCAVTVPAVAPGCYTLTATGTTGDSASLQFKVGSLCVSVNVVQGSAGTIVTVTGVGFPSTDTSAVLTFGGDDVTPGAGCPITNGSFSCALSVPPAVLGTHQIAARGTDGTINSAPFVVTGGITISPSAGPPGTKVTITGSGFALADMAFFVDFDLFPHGRIPFNQPGCPLVDGAGSCTFTIPTVPGRAYTVQATGSHARNAYNATFTVTAAIQLSPTSGPPGTAVTVTGAGFPASDTSNALGVGDFLLLAPPPWTGIGAPGQQCPVFNGNLSCTFNVPDLPAGTWWSVRVGSGTTAVFVRAPFVIGPVLQLESNSAAPGVEVVITGVGLSPADTSVKLSMDNVFGLDLTPPGGCPVLQGAFACSFVVPAMFPAHLNVRATGNTGSSGTVAFNITFGPPVITTPPTGASIVGTDVVVSGTGLPNGFIHVFEGTTLLGKASALASGHFSITVSLGLGPHTLTAVQAKGWLDIAEKLGLVVDRSPASAPVHVTIVNPAPDVTAAPAQTADEGANAAFALGSFADADADSPWAVAVTWGDGSAASNLVGTNVGELPSAAHTYTDNGVYTVTVSVTDKHGGSDSESFQVTVANTAPTASLGNNTPGDEGSPATITFSGQSDPSSADTGAGFHYAYSCDGGSLDGATYASSGSGATHTCTFDDGPATQTVRARIIDKDSGFREYTTEVQVTNVNPTASLASTGPVDEGSAATISLSGQSDLSSADVGAGFRYAYACDGSSLAGATYAGSSNVATQSCTFDDGPSTRTVRARIIDKDGGFSEYTTDVTVLNVAPVTVSLDANPLSVDEASPTLLSLTFTDPGSGDTHIADWDFGDDVRLADEIEPLRRDSRMQHTYADNGIYRTRVVVTDDDGGQASREIDVEVLNLAPAFVMAPKDQSIAERRTLTFEITGHDVAMVDVLTLSLDGLPLGAEYTSDSAAGDVRGVFTWTPACNQSGEYPLTFTLRDDDGGEMTASMTITVSEACRGVVAVTNRNGAFDAVTFVDPERNEAVLTVDVAHQPLAGLAFYDLSFDADLDAAKLYVNQQGPGSANVLIQAAGTSGDAAFAFMPILEVPVGNKPAGVAVTPDGAQVWTADSAGDSISILDRATDAVMATIPVKKAGLKPEGIAFGRERYAYVPARNSNNVLVVDRGLAVSSPARAIVGSAATGRQPIAALVDPSGGLLFVATADGVEVLSLASSGSPAPVARVASSSPGGLAMAAGKLYVTNMDRDTVDVFAVTSTIPYLEPVAAIPVGAQPSGIAAAPADALMSEMRLYVANRLGDSLTVIDALTDTVIATVPVGRHPRGVAVAIVPSK